MLMFIGSTNASVSLVGSFANAARSRYSSGIGWCNTDIRSQASVRVPSRAVGLLCVATRCPANILRMGDGFKVRWLDADLILAEVVDVLPALRLSNPERIGEPVDRSDAIVAVADFSVVTVAGTGSGPLQAVDSVEGFAGAAEGLSQQPGFCGSSSSVHVSTLPRFLDGGQ